MARGIVFENVFLALFIKDIIRLNITLSVFTSQIIKYVERGEVGVHWGEEKTFPPNR